MCPVCWKQFLDAASVRRDVSHRAHIIPRGLGGTATTCVCRSCDSQIGHRIEAPVLNLIGDLQVVSGLASGKVLGRLHMDSLQGPLPMVMSFSQSGGWKCHLPKPGDGDKAFPDLKPGPIIGAPPRIEFKYSFDKGRLDAAVRLLVLKVAYYGAFEWLGYGYAMRPDVAWAGPLLLGSRSRQPYIYCIDPPAGGYTLSLSERPNLTSRLSHLAFCAGSLDGIPVLLGLVQLQRRQFFAILPPREGGSALPKLSARLSGSGPFRVSLCIGPTADAVFF